VIGVFGGTFDPVHFGHLRPAIELHEYLGLDQLHLVPCRIPPHRQQPQAAPDHRLAMLELAAVDFEGFVVDRREMEREGPSYMVDTLASLRDEYPDESIVLLLGLDAFIELESWHQWERLFDLAHIVVSHRPGAESVYTDKLKERVHKCETGRPENLSTQKAGLVLFHEVTQLDISATAIRTLYSEGKSTQYLMPDVVRQYIEEHGLYRAC
jgi:nicotinate-nucleotide adenylyltransferase